MNTIQSGSCYRKRQLRLNTFKRKINRKNSKRTLPTMGPIMAERDGRWISLKSSNRSMNSLVQSWVRTKSKGFDDYKKQWT
jgi:hypothetical protein